MSDTRTKLLNVAEDLIQRHGLNGMSFQDLSDAVGIRKASVHHHFASKSEMVNALLERFLDSFAQTVQAILETDQSGKDQLHQYCRLFLQTLQTGDQDKFCLCGMLAAEMKSLDERGLNLIQQFMSNNLQYIQQMVAKGVGDGSLKAEAAQPTTAEMIFATLEGGVLVARCEGGPKRLESIVARLVESFAPSSA